jgi:hypothetical protein
MKSHRARAPELDAVDSRALLEVRQSLFMV